MNSPIVSVGLQFWNSERTVAAAIRSIQKQSVADWELIAHDDGSCDRGAEVVMGFKDSRIRFHRDTVNRQRPYRLNQSLEMARGEFYAVMDADDVAYPERLERQLEFLGQNPEVDLVGGGMMVFCGEGVAMGKRIPPVEHERICCRPWAGFPIAQPTFMGRTAWFKLHKYCNAFPPAEDQDLLLRSYRSSRFANLTGVVMGYRENHLSWRRLARGRECLIRAVCRQLRVEGRTGLIPIVILMQAMKSLADGVSIVTGLKYQLLRHRARTITGGEREEWRRVYESVTT
jgi:glycosyltransferase involved in cell wall biosynthesis